jgi:hypothetical protein
VSSPIVGANLGFDNRSALYCTVSYSLPKVSLTDGVGSAANATDES